MGPDVLVQPAGLADQVQRALLDLGEHPRQVLPEDAQGDELHAAEEQDHHHHRGIAGHVDALHEDADDEEGGIQQGAQRQEQADIAPHLERRGGEGGDAVHRQAPQAPVVPARLAGQARVAVVVHRGLAKPHPGEQPLHEAGALRHAAQGLHHAPVHEPEVAGVARDVHLADAVQQAVEQARGGALDGGLAVAHPARGIDHVVALAPARDHLRDQFRRVLQVGVDRHHGGAGGMIQAGGERHLLAEVARQVDDLDAGLARVPVQQALEGVVAAAVVDADDLPAASGLVEDAADTFEEGVEVVGLVVHRRDDGDFGRLFHGAQ